MTLSHMRQNTSVVTSPHPLPAAENTGKLLPKFVEDYSPLSIAMERGIGGEVYGYLRFIIRG
jgi:hypothetical protein